MSKIKLKEIEKDIKLSDKSSVITSGMKTAYIKTKEKAENLTEDNQQNSEEYANDMLENIASDTSNTAQELANHKFKQSAQEKTCYKYTEEIPNRKDILAIYAVKATADFEGVEVVTVNKQKA